jgi:hypothetical protein
LDGQQFWVGAQTPQFRYFSSNDPLGQLPPVTHGNNHPVRLNVGSNIHRNQYIPSTGPPFPYQGNLLFCHDSNTVCNVGFSDGSVRQFTAVVQPDLTVQSHDAFRRYFMIDYPEGVIPDPSLPSFDGAPGPRPRTRDPLRPPAPVSALAD